MTTQLVSTDQLAPPSAVDLAAALARQRVAFHRDGFPSVAARVDRIDRLIAGLARAADEIVDALEADYGIRPRMQSLASDVLSSITALKFSRARVGRWVRPRRALMGPGLALAGVRAVVRYEPLGVVGIVAPWNFPVTLSMHPLGQSFAAGNRAMVKISETTPHTGAVVARVLTERFDADELLVVNGGVEVAVAFAALPFDHLFFTGSTATGRSVMRAAAENLVPVTLELGGKCPAVIGRRADLDHAARSVMFGKTFNAGQFCVAPDYALVPDGSVDAFTAAARRAVQAMHPGGVVGDRGYTAVVDERHFTRLLRYVDEAQAGGAAVEVLTGEPLPRPDDTRRQIPPTVVVEPDRTTSIAREEVFGPLLAVFEYRSIGEVIERVGAGPSPLAAYYFGPADSDRRAFVASTRAGGMTINDIMVHVGVERIPFGGVGASGFGRYHGRAGFEAFSLAKPVVTAPARTLTRFANPPYSPRAAALLSRLVAREGDAAERRVRRRSTPTARPRSVR